MTSNNEEYRELSLEEIKDWISNYEEILKNTKDNEVREFCIRRIEKLAKKISDGDYY